MKQLVFIAVLVALGAEDAQDAVSKPKTVGAAWAYLVFGKNNHQREVRGWAFVILWLRVYRHQKPRFRDGATDPHPRARRLRIARVLH